MIENGQIITHLKTALVVPLFKGGPPGEVSSYRPISILSSIVKILEKHISRTMTSYLDTFDILSSNQYGFIAGRGTQSLLEDFSDHLHASFENNLVLGGLFLDVANAFNTVSNILLQKLYSIGFRGAFYTLLKSFLSDRTQIVSLNDVRSSKVNLTAGVPQGSILSPLLFNIYVNDIGQVVSGCRIQFNLVIT